MRYSIFEYSLLADIFPDDHYIHDPLFRDPEMRVLETSSLIGDWHKGGERGLYSGLRDREWSFDEDDDEI